MAAISTWSIVAGSNNSNAPDGAPEGMAPSGVNDTIREIMAAVRRWYVDAAWLDFGYTHTRLGSADFSLDGDYTAVYEVGRRVRMSGSATTYGTISASSYSAPNTLVTIAEDNVPATLSAVAVSLVTISNSPFPGVVQNDVTFQGQLTLTASSGGTSSAVIAQSATPAFSLYNTGGATNEKGWDLYASATALIGRAYNDASTLASNWLAVTRSGYTITDIAFATGSTVERLRIKSTGQVRFQPLASDPSGAENGDVYYNSTTNKLRVYADSVWTDLH